MGFFMPGDHEMAENVGGIYYDIELNIQGLLTAQQRVNQRLDVMERGFDSTTRSIESTEQSMSSLSRVAIALTAALSVRQVAEYADAWATVNNKLANSLRPSEQLADVTERVFNITQQTRGSLDATASLYARLERATRQYGTSADDLSKLTTIINQGFVVSGATAQEAENAIIQLSQGLASGALRGEEFNSVNEQGNRLIVALADSMGVSIGEMRNMAAQGELTTEAVVNGLLSQGVTIGEEFAKTTTTVSQALQVAGNNITKFFGENSTVKTGAGIFNDAVVTASENIGILSGALTAVAAIMGSRYIGALTMATSAKVQDTAASIEQSKSSAVAAKDAEIEAAAKLRLAEVEKAATISALSLAEGRLATIRATNASVASEVQLAEAQTAEIRTQIAQIQSEKALEAQRLKAQITDQGRIATATRMAQLQQASTVLNQRLAASEAATAQARAAAVTQAESAVSSARLAAADATGVATAANGRYIASQTAAAAAARAASLSIGLARGALSLIGGPAGAAMLAAGAIFYFWQKAQQAKEEAIRFADSLESVNASMKAMNNAQLKGTIADANESIRAQKDEISDLQAKVDSLNSRYRNFTPEAQAVAESMGQGADFARRQAEVSDELAKKSRDLANAQDKLARTQDTAAEANRTLTNNMLTSMGVHDGLIEKGFSLEQVQNSVARAFGNTADEINRANQAGQNFNPKSLQVAPPTTDGDKVILNLEEQNELLKIQDERQRSVTKARMQAAKVTDNPNQISKAGDLAGENYDLQKAEEARQASQRKGEQQNKRSASSSDAAATALARQSSAIERLSTGYSDGSVELAKYDAVKSLGSSATQQQIAEAEKNAEAEWRLQKAKEAVAKADRDKQVAQSNFTNLQGQASPVAAVDNQFQQQMEQLNQYAILYPQKIAEVEATRAAIEEQYRQQRMAAQWEELSQMNLGYSMLTSAVDAFSGNASNALTGLITGTMSAQEAMRSLGNTMLNSVVNALVQVGVEALKNFIIGQTLGATATAAGASQAAILATAWAPAAAMASLASFGANSVPAMTGIASTVGLAQGLALTGMRYNGGPVNAGGLYQVGERGKPEIYQASTGKQYMIPGDNGKVISNKDMQGAGGGGVVINIQNYTSSSVDAQAGTDANGGLTVDVIVADLNNGGPISSGITSNFNVKRTPRGQG
ncbi:tape measure protein [Enterobacter hormaechei]